jgi:chromosome segregation ATPase
MSELVVGFHDEIYAENSSLRHRSEENRKRCIALEGKLERLQQRIGEMKAEKNREKTQRQHEVADVEARLAGAIETIEALKEERTRDKQEYHQLLREYNERTAQAQWLREALENVKLHYERAAVLLSKSQEDVERLKEVNVKLIEELRRVQQLSNNE